MSRRTQPLPLQPIPAIGNLELNLSDRGEQSQVALLAATDLFVAQGGKTRRVARRVALNALAGVAGSTRDLRPELLARSEAGILWAAGVVGWECGGEPSMLI